jgi:TonB family protein
MSFALNIVLKTTFLMLCTTILSLLLRRSSASVRHAVWLLGMIAMLFLPVASLIVPQFEWSVLPAVSTSVTFLPVEKATAGTPLAERGLTPATTDTARKLLAAPEFLWFMGTVVLFTRFATGFITVRRMAKGAIVATDESWHELTRGMNRRVRLLITPAPVSPMTWGVWRHTILLPSSASEWSDERRRFVLAHELAHVQRNDGFIQILVQAICGVYWFNPLVWYAARRIRIERERACDDRVLELGAAATDYAEHLVQIARSLRTQRRFALAAVSMAHPSQLETRLVSILDSRASRRVLPRATGLMLFGFVALLTFSIARVGVTAALPLPPVLVAAIKAPPAPSQRTRIGNGNSASVPGVIPPKILQSTSPMYTPDAIRAHVEGTVTLEGTVDIQGKVSGLHVIKSLRQDLDRNAIDAVLRWKFSPAVRNGLPVEAVMQIEVDFKIPRPRDLSLRITTDGSPANAERGQSNESQPDAQDSEPPIQLGPGVTPPTVVFRVEPQYTPEARAEKYNGTVVLKATVHENGTLTVIDVVRGLDFGLTEKAIEAIELWKFRPGMKDGKAVAVTLNVEVNFNLR